MSPMNVRNRFPFRVFIFGFFAIVKKISKLDTHEEKFFAKFKHGNLAPIKKIQIINRKRKKKKKERLAFYSNSVQDVCIDNSQIILKLVIGKFHPVSRSILCCEIANNVNMHFALFQCIKVFKKVQAFEN